MRKGMTLLLIFVTLGLISIASGGQAQQTAPSAQPFQPGLVIPIYENHPLIGELYLSNADLLPMVKQAIATLGDKSSGPLPGPAAILNQLNFDELAKILSELQAFRVAFYSIPNLSDLTKVEEFYRDNLTKAGYVRILLLKPDENSSINAFALGTQSLFTVVVRKQGNNALVTASVTKGLIDLAKLMNWAKNALAQIQKFTGPKPTSKGTATTPKPSAPRK